MRLWLVVGIACLASSAHADGPSLEGRLALGVRTSWTSASSYAEVFDDTSSLRLAADGLVGARIGSFVVGLHGGVATPLKFDSVSYFGEAETLPETTSNIYPLDVGVGVELDTRSKIWFSGWIGATVAFAHARSPAVFLNNIDSYGAVPAVAWRYSTTSLGYGGAVGYDVDKSEYGRVALLLGLDSEGIGAIPVRDNTGRTGKDISALTCTSITFGLAYAY